MSFVKIKRLLNLIWVAKARARCLKMLIVEIVTPQL
jgi:hypothetical protein